MRHNRITFHPNWGTSAVSTWWRRLISFLTNIRFQHRCPVNVSRYQQFEIKFWIQPKRNTLFFFCLDSDIHGSHWLNCNFYRFVFTVLFCCNKYRFYRHCLHQKWIFLCLSVRENVQLLTNIRFLMFKWNLFSYLLNSLGFYKR